MRRTLEETITLRPPVRGSQRSAAERLRLLAQTVAVAVQVAWFTVVGWVGATITLLPLAFQGGPVGRRDERRALRFRLVPTAATEEATGR